MYHSFRFQLVYNVVVYGPLRVKARAIKDTKLRWKIPKNFPDEHRPSNGLYTVLCVGFFFSYIFSFIRHFSVRMTFEIFHFRHENIFYTVLYFYFALF